MSLSTNKEFDDLRLKFTLIFLANNRMFETYSYKQIIEKAYDFTEEYVKATREYKQNK